MTRPQHRGRRGRRQRGLPHDRRRNPQVADPPQWMALKQAKARGARLLVIDPFQTSAARWQIFGCGHDRAPTARSRSR